MRFPSAVTKELTIPVTTFRGWRAAVRALAGSAALLACAAPAAQADTLIAALPGESFPVTSTALAVTSDAAAIDGRTLAVWANTSTARTVQLPSAATTLTVRARGSQCDGAPAVRVSVDGAVVLTAAVATTSYSTISAPVSLAGGGHTVSVAFTNDYRVANVCDRNLFVDQVELRASSTTTSTTSTTSTSTTSTTTQPLAPPKLRWAPPALSAPTTIQVPQGDVSLTLDTTKDYILKLGASTHLGGLAISGGRNVVMVGGAIGVPASSSRNTALSIKDATGTVHVEGVWFDGSLGHEMDAIQIIAPKATVQVENVRATGLVGSYTTNHTDVIQPWGGVLALRVDRLTADSTYQGLFTRPDQGPIGSVTLQNVDLTYVDPGTTTGGYMLWMTTGCKMAKTSLSNVYITPGPKRTLGNSVWPATSDSTCPAVVSGSTASWPKLPVTGVVTAGAPAAGAYVPAGAAGIGYVSPGYL